MLPVQVFYTIDAALGLLALDDKGMYRTNPVLCELDLSRYVSMHAERHVCLGREGRPRLASRPVPVRPIRVKKSSQGQDIAAVLRYVVGAFNRVTAYGRTFVVLLCVAMVATGFDEEAQEFVASAAFGMSSGAILEQIRRYVGSHRLGELVEKTGGLRVVTIPRTPLLDLARGRFCPDGDADGGAGSNLILEQLGIDHERLCQANIRKRFSGLIDSMNNRQRCDKDFLDTIAYDHCNSSFVIHFHLVDDAP